MTIKTLHIILFLWCGLLWATPNISGHEAVIPNAVHPNNEVAKDSLSPREKDSTKSKKLDPQHLEHLRQLAALRSINHASVDIATASLGNQTEHSANASGLLKSPPLNTIHGNKTSNQNEVSTKTFRTFPSLDQKLSDNRDFNFSLANRKPEFTREFIASNYPKNPKVDTLIAQAKRAFAAVKELGNFVDIITGKELLELPVGLKKKDSTSQNTVELAITEVQFTPQYAEFKAWAKMTVPQKGENGEPERELYYGAEGIKLSHDGALLGDMKLVLLGNQAIPMNGDNWLLTLKGDIDLKNGAFGDQSFVEFDCSGLKSISLEADLRISRNVLLPITSGGNYQCGDEPDTKYLKDSDVVNNKCYVGASFSVKANGWNDLLVEVSLPKFEVRGLKGWGFNVKKAVLDLSDSRNASGMKFPKDYKEVLVRGERELWRGFYAKEISVILPKGIENTKSSNKRVQFGAEHLILDSEGVSGTFFAENVLNIGEGSAGKWAFTIADVSISLSRNSLTGGSIGGDIAVPIFEKPMDYSGYIQPDGYGLTVGLQSDYQTPVFLGEMQLARNSSVSIDVQEGSVYPSANLSGQLSIVGKIGQEEDEEQPTPEEAEESGKGFNFPGIQFEQLKLETEPGKKQISAKSFGFTGEMTLMNFPASVENLELITPTGQVGLSFGLKINLDGEGSHATTSMDILGKLEEDARIQEWKFERVKVDGVEIDFKKSGIHLTGNLELMSDDPTYGDGFSGGLMADIEKLNYTVEGKAMFGAKDFRYWFVDIWSTVKEASSSKLLINSFAGGLSQKMKRKTDGRTTEFNPSKAVYIPDANTGLGLRAGVGIGTSNATAFKAKVFLEMEFNSNGGLNRIGFTGEGSMMSESGYASPVKQLEANNKMLKGVTDFIEKNKDKAEDFIKNNDFLGLSKNAVPKREVASAGRVGAFVGIEKDFVNDSFHGEFEVYLDLEGIRGGNEDNLAGRAVIHTSPSEWYLNIGTPETPISLIFDVKLAELQVGGYFMTGTELPSAVPPRKEVTRILGNDIIHKNRSGKGGMLDAAKGFAFGLNFSYQYNYDYMIFYAFVKFGGGFDIMHAYYSDVECVGRTGPVGNNGWYSMGQIYAFLEGEFGVEVDLAFIKGNFPIAYVGVAALLRGQFPNPIYLKGYIGMRYEILGGLVSGNMRMKFEAGEECEMVGVSDALGVPIISDIIPRDGDQDVSVYAAPQAVFTYTMNKDITVELEEGKRTFNVKLKQFTLESDNTPIEGTLEWNDNNDAVTFRSKKTLPSEKEVKAFVEVSFDEKINGGYQTLIEDGKPVTEKSEIVFRTSKAPDHIPWEQVVYVYPIKEQQNFYPQEYPTGYVKMKSAPEYLFQGGYEMRAQFVSTLTKEGVRSSLRYDEQKGMVFFDIPELVPESEYRLDLMVYPPGQDAPSEIFVQEEETVYDDEAAETNWFDPGSGTQSVRTDVDATAVVKTKKASSLQMNDAAPKSILDMEFRTSRHSTFKDKINKLQVTDNLTNNIFFYDADNTLDVYAKVQSLSIKVADYEPLEKLEILGGDYAPKPLVYAEAQLNDSYYKKYILPMMYDIKGSDPIYPIDGIEVNRDKEVYGVPPVRSFYLGNEYLRDYENNPESTWVKNRIPFIYNLSYQYQEDFIYLRYRLSNKYTNPTEHADIYEKYNLLLTKSFPAFRLGDYDANLIYRTPGNIYSKGYKVTYSND